MVLQFPVPGQQFGDAPGRVILQARQHIDQPSLRIDVVELGGLDQRVDGRGAPTAGIEAGEGPVVAAIGRFQAPSADPYLIGVLGRTWRRSDVGTCPALCTG